MSVTDRLDTFDRVLDGVSGVLVERDVSAASLTTYRTGGSIRALVRLSSRSALPAVADAVAASGLDTLPIGNGSNLLVADVGFDGVGLILEGEFADVSIEAETGVVRLGGGAGLPVAARATVRAGLTGFEWAVGVPGRIGGAVRMNAGGHGSDMAHSLVDVDIVDLRRGVVHDAVSAATLDLGYRCSRLGPHELVTSATLQLDPATSVDTGAETLREIVSWRRAHQPGGPNAGSVFTNPAGDSAGRLIDLAGAKGLRVGGAEVSPKHANFIQAGEGASADDVLTLMERLVDLVDERHGVRLHAETRLVGFGRDRVAYVQPDRRASDDDA